MEEALDQGQATGSNLNITSLAITYIRQMKSWATFVSIMGFISSGLILILAFFIGSIFEMASSQMGGALAIPTTAITVVYIILAVVWFLPHLFLYKASSALGTAISSGDSSLVDAGFKNLRSCFMTIGILWIIYLAFILLAIIL